MMRSGPSIVSKAFAAMSVRLIAIQIALAALVFALAVVWLRLPDSNALNVVISIVLGIVLLALASGGEIALMLRLCHRPLALSRVLKGAAVFLACVALWFLWNCLIATLQSQEVTLAGYLNSRFPASLRNIFSFAHIDQALEWMASLLRWFGAGILAAVVYSVAAATKFRNAIRHVLFSFTYWVALIVGCLAASTLTGLLMHWTPGHALSIEMISLVLRLVTVTVLDAVIVLFVLAVLSACIQRGDRLMRRRMAAPITANLSRR